MDNVKQVPDVRKLQSLLAEFIGTLFISLTILLSNIPSNPGNPVAAFTAVGCVLGSMIYAFDHIR